MIYLLTISFVCLIVFSYFAFMHEKFLISTFISLIIFFGAALIYTFNEITNNEIRKQERFENKTYSVTESGKVYKKMKLWEINNYTGVATMVDQFGKIYYFPNYSISEE